VPTAQDPPAENAVPEDVVAQLNATLNDHDLAGGRALYSAEPVLVMASGHQLDLDGLDRLMEMTLAAFPDMRISLRRALCDGETVVTEEVLEGTHKGLFAGIAPTGREVRLPMVHVTVVRGGRIVERTAYHDTAGILRQLTSS
jgi:predicted ester cyclase